MEVDDCEFGNQHVSNDILEQNSDEREVYQTTERKITQTDHLNKQLLNAFLQRINTEQISNVNSENEREVNDESWSVDTSSVEHEINSHGVANDIKKNFLVVGISGPTNSGKTTLTASLQKAFPGSTHICQDSYFHEPGDPRLTWVEEVKHHNWELLSALDMKAMTEDVKNWMEKQKQQDSVEQSVLLVEGYTIFNYEPLCELFDKRYFMVTSRETCHARRLQRTYNPPDVEGYFEKVVWPHYVQSFNEIKDRSNIVFLEECLSKEERFSIVKKDIDDYFILTK